jgi:hypothetical protein
VKHIGPDAAATPSVRPRFEVADVFAAHGETYRQCHRLSGDQQRAMRDIVACRTAALGGHLDVCPKCDFSRPSYNSCRNRHCPKCQSLAQARWIEARIARLLPVHYFHCVFTLPQELRSVAKRNPKVVFDLLFAAASATLLELGHDQARLGAQLGITTVLHTWTRKLTFHPHLHCIVTGGGLTESQDRWIPANRRYLFPVKVMAKLFRGKFTDALRRVLRQGKLALDGTDLAAPGAFGRCLDKLYATNWVVYSKAPFLSAEHVIRYLGRYTHRVAISNQRIQDFDGRTVRFATKGGDTAALTAEDFVGRFLLHILPSGFSKIRHHGLHAASNAKTKLAVAKRLLVAHADDPQPAPITAGTAPTFRELLTRLTGVDPLQCPVCGTVMQRHPLPRAPPLRSAA